MTEVIGPSIFAPLVETQVDKANSAMLSTVVAVLGSGHLADWLGTARAIAQSALCLIGACLGFALVPGVDFSLWLCGLVLGLGYVFFFNLNGNPLHVLYGGMGLLVVCTIAH